ncbi:MAG: cysteine hydrolase [Deltaproteobacteria bacterium]|nr:cysteine hydrolase [Deltaproteobacteria bacterium]
MKERYLDDTNAARVLESITAALEGTRGRRPLPDLSRSALVLLDLQRIFVDPDSPAFLPAWPAVQANARRLAAAFRSAGRSVIMTRHVHAGSDPGGTIAHFFGRLLTADDPLCCLSGSWEPGPQDAVIDKPRHSAFERSSLAGTLAQIEADVVVLAGVQAHLCVLATAVEAGSRDLLPVVALDAVAAPNLALHTSTLRALSGGLAWISTVDEIGKKIAGGP